jgi:hypothetical protein
MDTSLRRHDALEAGATSAPVIPAQSRERLTSPRHSREGGNPHTVNDNANMIVPVFARRRIDASLRWHDGLKAGVTSTPVMSAAQRRIDASLRWHDGLKAGVTFTPVMPAARRRMDTSLRWHDALKAGATSTPVIPAQAGIHATGGMTIH